MRRISTTKAFARQVTDTIAGKIRWPATPEQRKQAEADLAAAAAIPESGDAYGRLLASRNDWLSRWKRAHPELVAEAEAKAAAAAADKEEN
jgi:hypothetical protein